MPTKKLPPIIKWSRRILISKDMSRTSWPWNWKKLKTHAKWLWYIVFPYLQKQKKTIKDEFNVLFKQKAEQNEILINLQSENIDQKETIDELLKRITEIEIEYEEKISRQEQQLWSANAQLKEEASKAEEDKARALSASNKRREEAAAAAAAAAKHNVDSEIISDIEKKWQRKK